MIITAADGPNRDDVLPVTISPFGNSNASAGAPVFSAFSLAMKQLGSLKGSEAHSTVILPEEDKNVLRKLGINVTFDPVHQHKKLYHKK